MCTCIVWTTTNLFYLKEESINLRKFSTVSGMSAVSAVSTKTIQSEMVISEEEEDRMDEFKWAL